MQSSNCRRSLFPSIARSRNRGYRSYIERTSISIVRAISCRMKPEMIGRSGVSFLRLPGVQFDQHHSANGNVKTPKRRDASKLSSSTEPRDGIRISRESHAFARSRHLALTSENEERILFPLDIHPSLQQARGKTKAFVSCHCRSDASGNTAFPCDFTAANGCG